jgi:GDPmannose 4,6-dehydratase
LLFNKNFSIYEGDVTDAYSVYDLISFHRPFEVYNLAAQSHVHTSFDQPSYSFNVNCNGVLHILEAIRRLNPYTRFYQASTSEMFGDKTTLVYTDHLEPIVNRFQDENTPFSPMSPYAVAKTAAHQLVNNYRKAYGLHASCGILFNHESPLRGENFVTQKIAKFVGKNYRDWGSLMQDEDFAKQSEKLKLGNLDAKRDWGHAKDYVRAMWLMLQQTEPDDYVVATGETHSVREFCELAFKRIESKWTDWVESESSLFRPSEVPYLLGKADKARNVLGWKPEVTFEQLVNEMVDAQLQ